MSYSSPRQSSFQPVEATIDYSQLQFSDYPNNGLQVADYSKVEYLEPSDSEDEGDEMNYTHGDSKYHACHVTTKNTAALIHRSQLTCV